MMTAWGLLTIALLGIRVACCRESPMLRDAGRQLTPPPLNATDSSPTLAGLQIPAVQPVQDSDERQFHISSDRLLPGFVECPCTASGRSFNVSRVLTSDEARAALVAGDRVTGRALFARCVQRHRFEACVNWAAATVIVNGARMCALDMLTFRSVVSIGEGQWRTTGRCDERPDTRSPPDALLEVEMLEDVVEPSPEADSGGYGGQRSGNGKDDEDVESFFEGCVSVEHLRGAQLQHPRNLKRRVLCAENGLCATPRHVIVADGYRASMQKLCGDKGPWRCRFDTRWVNNIRVSHRVWAPRGVRGNVLVTPYHAWVPPPIHWVLAVMEDVFILLYNALRRGLQLVCVAFAFELIRRGFSWAFSNGKEESTAIHDD